MNSSMYCHMSEDDRIACKTQGQDEKYPVLEIGDIRIFPQNAGQLREIRDAITEYMISQKVAVLDANGEASPTLEQLQSQPI
jgi:hypothetical protein